MTRYLVDTNVLVNASRGREPAARVLRSLLGGADEVLTCSVVLTEFYSGAPRGRFPRLDAWLDTLGLVPITRSVAIAAGTHRFLEARRGWAVSTPDAMIGAAAAGAGCVLLTDNERDFHHPGLRVTSTGALRDELGI